MDKVFDNKSRFLMRFDTTSWARFLGIETNKAELCNADLSTVASQAGATLLAFHYEVIRVWQLKAEALIESGLGVPPLAFIAQIDSVKLPILVKRAEERLERVADPGTIGEFWTSIDILMGLKHERPFVTELLNWVRAIKETVTYQEFFWTKEKPRAKRRIF